MRKFYFLITLILSITIFQSIIFASEATKPVHTTEPTAEAVKSDDLKETDEDLSTRDGVSIYKIIVLGCIIAEAIHLQYRKKKKDS